MKEFFKKNFAIILAFALPIIIMIAVALSVYLPALFLSTNYNFVYVTCTNNNDSYPYNCNSFLAGKYSVKDGKLIINTSATSSIDYFQNTNSNNGPSSPIVSRAKDLGTYNDRIFLHDTKSNQSREITIEEAKTLTLNNLVTSPDGVSVTSNYNNGGDFFIFGGGRSSFGYYLTKGQSRTKLNLINITNQYYNQNNFQFIGWVLPGTN